MFKFWRIGSHIPIEASVVNRGNELSRLSWASLLRLRDLIAPVRHIVRGVGHRVA